MVHWMLAGLGNDIALYISMISGVAFKMWCFSAFKADHSTF
jgi:hypothetical protein